MAAGDWKELFIASANGNLELVKYHIKMGIDVNYQHPEFMCTPLIESIQKEQYEVAKCLLENGADPTIKEDFGTHIPLSMAHITKNQYLIVLVESYLDKNLQSTNSNNVKQLFIANANESKGNDKTIAQRLFELILRILQIKV